MKKVIAVLLILSAFFSLYAGGSHEETEVASGPVTIELWSSLSATKAEVFDESTRVDIRFFARKSQRQQTQIICQI